MRLAGSLFLRAVVLSLVVIAAITVCLLAGAVPAAAGASLDVQAKRGLSLMGEADAVHIEGPPGLLPSAADGSSKAILTVTIGGPVGLSLVGSHDLHTEVVFKAEKALLPETRLAEDGSLRTHFGVAPGALPLPGAYLVEARVTVGSEVVAAGTAWLGKMAVRSTPVDVAVIWPLSLGIHRDVDGVFFDGSLEEALTAPNDRPGRIATLAGLAEEQPAWRFTLAVEPVLLTQLRDMADGYRRLDASGAEVEVGAETAPASAAAFALRSLEQLAAADQAEVIIMPYAGASVDQLARNGWTDGLFQIQLGKQVTQQSLAIPAPIFGAYASDLDITTDGLGSYGRASIDHVLVRGSVSEDLMEPLPAGKVTARVRDRDSQRVALVFADEQIQTLMSPPWDTGVFFAGLAAAIASRDPEALVLTPEAGEVIPPLDYLEAMGGALERIPGIRTLTLSELVRTHSPGTRPVLLERDSTAVPGFIEREISAEVRAAHQAVEDITAAAGLMEAPVTKAQAMLYTAQSLWWSSPGTGPEIANKGLAYAEGALRLAEEELAKIGPIRFKNRTVTGSRGEVLLFVGNEAAYPMVVDVTLSAHGLVLSAGDEKMELEVPPGGVTVPLAVEKTKGIPRLQAEVAAGSRTLGQVDEHVRFLTVLAFLPWAIGGVLFLAVVGTMLWRMRLKKKSPEGT